MTHDCPHILGGETSGPSVIKKVRLVCQKAKSDACWYLKAIGKHVDQALYPKVVVQRVTIKIAKFRDIPLEGGAMEGNDNIGFY